MTKTALTASRKALILLTAEFVFLFLATPVFFYFYGTRSSMAIVLWAATAYAAFWLRADRSLRWQDVWHGNGWSASCRRHALFRFMLAFPAVVILTGWLAPQHLFRFPLERPGLWLAVMLIYPLVSALPQELLFRSFFFRRYASLLRPYWLLAAINTVSFALLHIVFHNWVSPLLSAAGSLLFAFSYHEHKSLKWAMLEHACYGCLIFTVGIGFYFVTRHC